MHFQLTNSSVKWVVVAGFFVLLFCFISSLSMVIRVKREEKKEKNAN